MNRNEIHRKLIVKTPVRITSTISAFSVIYEKFEGVEIFYEFHLFWHPMDNIMALWPSG